MSYAARFASILGYLDPKCIVIALQLGISPGLVVAEILWDGGYETGDFMQWHGPDSSENQFSQIPAYGRPTRQQGGGDNSSSYFGDGSLLELVTSPVRNGRYAAKFTVKNSLSGTETADCDVPFPTCDRRRTELTNQNVLTSAYNGLPYMAERWISISHYVPSNWSNSGSGTGPTLFQVKPRDEQGLSSTILIELHNGNWSFWHRYWPSSSLSGSHPWQYQMFYSGNEGGSCYPRANSWPDGVAHFPDRVASCAALQSVTKGGWTDWVINVRFDARGAGAGGTGFLKVWKREDSGSWVHVLDIRPGVTTRGGETFDMGIGFPKTNGFGLKAGMYMDKEQVWDLPANRVIYNDNIKVGSERATFAEMSPDGSTPSSITTSPMPPEELSAD